MNSLIQLVLSLGLFTRAPAQGAPQPIPPPTPGSFITIGDAGVPLLFVPWNSPQLRPPNNFPNVYPYPPYGTTYPDAAAAVRQYDMDALTTMLNAAKATPAPPGYGLQGVQYYLGWGVIEPTQGIYDWTQTLADANRVKAISVNGKPLELFVFGWTQNLPKWVHWANGTDNSNGFNQSYPRARRVDNNLETDALSIYADETKGTYHHYYSILANTLGPGGLNLIDKLRIECPYDYGEIGYPGGAANATFPQTNTATAAFWVGEAAAKAHFQATMQAKYPGINGMANLNAAWGTNFADFASLTYPSFTTDPRTSATSRRRWLDFVDWYNIGLTTKTGELIDVAKSYFPTQLLTINLGYPDERLNVGQDVSGLLKMTASRGMSVCSGTGLPVKFINTKRVATASRFYGGQWLASETTAGEQLPAMAQTYFKDLSDGFNWPFSYRANLDIAPDALARYREFGPNVYGRLARIDTAVFFPSTSHRLDDSPAVNDGTYPGYPGNLQSFCETLRDICDYGVIDESMITDGALSQYKLLVWPVGTWAEATTMTAISNWIRDGGVLLANDFTNIRNVDGAAGAFAALSALPKVGDMRVARQGFIFDAAGNQGRINQWIVQRGNMTPLNASYPEKISTLPVIDNTSDGVLATEFTNGVLLFNSTTSQKTVTLPPLDGQGAAQQVTVPPYTDGTTAGLIWVARVTQLPTITMFTPASAPEGATVTINGTNLTGATAVKFNGVTATIISNSDSQIVVTVPAGATSGTLSVSIAGGTATSSTVFTVLPTPIITSNSPLAPGTVGASYSQTLTASGGTPGYTWSVSSGTLPGGLSLSTAGVLSGTPTDAGTFNFTVQVTDGALASNTAAVSLAVVPLDYASWKSLYFTPEEQADPTVSGPTANPAGDGMVNLFKYAYGLLPGTQDFTHGPIITIQDFSGTNYLHMRYRRQLFATDLTYTVQVTSDLVTWNSGAGHTVVVSQSANGDGTDQVTVRDLIPATSQPRRFMRLMVSQP